MTSIGAGAIAGTYYGGRFILDKINPEQLEKRKKNEEYEDVNTYVSSGNKEDLFFTTAKLITGTKRTQKESGGLTEEYLDKCPPQRLLLSISPYCFINNLADIPLRALIISGI